MNSDPTSLDQQLLTLLHAVRDEQDDPACTTLNELLRHDPAARAAMARLLVDEHALIHRLRDDSIVSLLESVPAKMVRTPRWYSWRPLAAIAAGIVFGTFCTSVVFGLVAQRAATVKETPLPVFDPGLESTAPITARNVPNRVGIWGAQSARVVTAENGVEPREGQRMLRLEPTPRNKKGETFLSPAYQMLDLRSLPKASRGRDAEVQVTASFCAANSEVNSLYAIRIFALNQPPDKARSRFWQKKDEEGVAIVQQTFGTAPGEGGWRTFSLKMPLPRGARTLVFILAAGVPKDATEGASFYYLDDVRMSVLSPQATQL
jgi:hypothetical protein